MKTYGHIKISDLYFTSYSEVCLVWVEFWSSLTEAYVGFILAVSDFCETEICVVCVQKHETLLE